MTPSEIEALLHSAFDQCEAVGLPLEEQQKQILLQVAINLVGDGTRDGAIASPEAEDLNPLDELTPEQRQTLIVFVREQNRQNISWKAKLLNDWLQNQDSGSMQFIRELYGLQWLALVQPVHFAKYLDEAAVSLKVGDRIEIANNLWEWVQEDGPCSREWFSCTVISITEKSDTSGTLPQSYSSYTICTIRFDNGMEYEIQGVYEWNRYNWRWASSSLNA